MPGDVEQKTGRYSRCGLLEHGFLRVRCNRCHAGLTRLIEALAARNGRHLQRQRFRGRDAENSIRVDEGLEAGPMERLMGSSITQR